MAKSEKQLEKHLINDRMEAQLQQLMVINNNISEFKKKLQNEKDKLQPLNLDNLLLIAVEKRMKDFCEVLLLNGGNANHKHKGENEQGLIHYASTNSDSSILEMLVRHGANVEEFDKNGLTPLIYSVSSDSIKCTKFLIKKGARVEPPKILQSSNSNGISPLHVAAQKGSIELIQILLEAKANINYRDSQHRTALHFASKNGHYECVKYLLGKGAKADAKTVKGLSSIHIASEQGHHDTVRVLLKKANVDEKDCNEMTPLHFASYGGHVNCIKLLIEKEAEINAQNMNGDTPLHLVARSGKFEALKTILEGGGDPTICNDHNAYPIHFAIIGGNIKCIEELLILGLEGNINSNQSDDSQNEDSEGSEFEDYKKTKNISKFSQVADEKGVTPLHIAAQFGKLEVIRCLFSYGNIGSMVMAKDIFGATPLHMSADAGSVDVVKELILYGSSVKVQDASGFTPLQWAQRSKKIETIAIFESLKEQAEKIEKKKEKKRIKRENYKFKAKNKSDESINVDGQLKKNFDQLNLMDTEATNGIKTIGKITFDKNKKIGFGSHGTVVFHGNFEERTAAVKRIPKDFIVLAEKEIQLLTQLSEEMCHKNIVRYYGKEEDHEYIFLSVELCSKTLQQFLDETTLSFDPKITSIQRPIGVIQENNYYEAIRIMIFHMIDAVRYLHNFGIVHNDLKPDNILISNGGLLKISDMGLARKFDLENHTFTFTSERPIAQGIYYAPEVLPHSEHKKTSKVDIFSLGCLIYFMLTKGQHPFVGKFVAETLMNILEGKYDLQGLSCNYEAMCLVEKMIQKNPDNRPTIEEVVEYPFFLNNTQNIKIIEGLSRKISPQVQANLENLLLKKYSNLMEVIDPEVLQDLFKYRKYESTVFDLLRMIRNITEHFESRTDSLLEKLHQPNFDCEFSKWKKICLWNAEEKSTVILRYFSSCSRFPFLIMDLFFFKMQNSLNSL